jgi:putative SOS response-associated peptidase YedK
LIHVSGKEIFAMAGLYDSWTDTDTGEVVQTYTIITTTPNSKMRKIHDRMPVILDREEESMWLEDGVSDADLKLFLNPYEAKEIEMYEVDPRVGTVKGNNSIELTYPLNSK